MMKPFFTKNSRSIYELPKESSNFEKMLENVKFEHKKLL